MSQYCTGVGKAPSDENTQAAAKHYRGKYVAAHGHKPWFKDYPEPADPLYGRKGCPDCKGTYFPTKQGVMPKHKHKKEW